MQLSDIFEDTNPIMDALDETLFQEHLRKLSELPDYKKKEVEKIIRNSEFGLYDMIKIFGEDEILI